MSLVEKINSDETQETTKNSLPCPTADVSKELIVAEYNQLRAEVLKRIDIRYQMIQFTLTALGVFLTISFTIKNALPILAYPILVLMLSLTYIANAFEADKMKTYIKEQIEPRVPNNKQEEAFGWEHYRKSHRMKLVRKHEQGPFKTAGNLAANSIFTISSFIALGAGLLAIQLYGKDTDLGTKVSAMQVYYNFLLIAGIVTVIEFVVLFWGKRLLSLLYRKGLI